MLSYEFRPVGLKVKTERRECVKVENKLYKVFEKWLDEFSELYDGYDEGVEMIKNIKPKPTIDEVHSALIAYEDHPNIKHAGLLLSAVYNLVDDKIIVFDVDLDVPIDFLGYKLDKRKVLVNYSRVGDLMGWEASGVVINCGEVRDRVGYLASGVVINYKEIEGLMCWGASGVVINCGKVSRISWWTSGKIIAIKNPVNFDDELNHVKSFLREEKCRKIPKLIEYFDELKNKLDEGRNNPELLLGIFGDNPVDKIRKDVDELLRKTGYLRRWL
jgi:hypothetical protein